MVSWKNTIVQKCTNIIPERDPADRGVFLIRNNASTMSSQIIDTAIFITIAFYGTVPSIITMILSQYFIKCCYAVLDTPFFYLLTRKRKDEHTESEISE